MFGAVPLVILAFDVLVIREKRTLLRRHVRRFSSGVASTQACLGRGRVGGGAKAGGVGGANSPVVACGYEDGGKPLKAALGGGEGGGSGGSGGGSTSTALLLGVSLFFIASTLPVTLVYAMNFSFPFGDLDCFQASDVPG